MKKILIRVFAVIYISMAILCTASFLDYILVDDTNSYTRLMMHEFYNQDNIDILVVGASHCSMGFNPSIANEITDKKTFNASNFSQFPDTSYVLIKEAIQLYDVKEVFLDVSANIAELTGEYKKRTDLTGTYLISDYMRPSLNKIELLLNASSSEYYVNSFWKARRNWDSFFDFKYIDDLIRKKESEEYRNFTSELRLDEKTWYVEKGFVAVDESIDEHLFYVEDHVNKINIANISEDWKKTINSIIDCCNENNVKITLFAFPISCFQLVIQNNYDEYIDFIKGFIKNKNVEYIDFNLLKEDYFPYKQSNYEDENHFNIYGAEDFTIILSKYINGEIRNDAYYSSISEKLSSIKPDYYGIVYNDLEEQNVRVIHMISNNPDYYEYKVEIERRDGTSELLQDFSNNNVLSISKNKFMDSEGTPYAKIVISFRKNNIEESAIRIEY